MKALAGTPPRGRGSERDMGRECRCSARLRPVEEDARPELGRELEEVHKSFPLLVCAAWSKRGEAGILQAEL